MHSTPPAHYQADSQPNFPLRDYSETGADYNKYLEYLMNRDSRHRFFQKLTTATLRQRRALRYDSYCNGHCNKPDDFPYSPLELYHFDKFKAIQTASLADNSALYDNYVYVVLDSVKLGELQETCTLPMTHLLNMRNVHYQPTFALTYVWYLNFKQETLRPNYKRSEDYFLVAFRLSRELFATMVSGYSAGNFNRNYLDYTHGSALRSRSRRTA